MLRDGDGLGGADAARRLPRRRRPAAGARGGRPGAVGPRPGGARAGRSRADRRRAAATPCRSTRRSARRTARARPPQRGAAAARGLRLREGQGRRRRRRRPRRRGARRARARTSALRLDANGAWDVDEAVARDRGAGARRPRARRGAGARHRSAARGARARRACAIAMDETAAEPGALASGAADAVCLKVSRAAASPGCWRRPRSCATTGAEVYLASTLDGPLGIAAGAALRGRAARRAACGLATLGALRRPRSGVLAGRPGAIARARRGPGLGVDAADLAARAGDDRARAPPGACAGIAWPGAGPTTGATARGIASARRSPSAANFSSRSPADHRDDRHRAARRAGPTAAPSRRSRARAARRRGRRGRCAAIVLAREPRDRRRRRRRTAAARVQRSANSSIVPRSISSASASSAARRARALRGVLDARRVVADQHEPRRRARAPRARRAARAARPSSSRTSANALRRGARARRPRSPRSVIGRARGARAVPADVGRERAIAFRPSRSTHRRPSSRPRPREAVEQDDVGSGIAPTIDARAPTPTCCCARSSTSSRAAASPAPCTSPGSRSTPLVLSLVRDGAASVRGRTSTSAAPASSRSGWRRPPGARRRWPARRAPPPPTTCRP